MRSAVDCIISAFRYQVVKNKYSELMKEGIQRDLQRSSLSFFFEPVTADDMVEKARREMIKKIKKFSDLTKEVKQISKKNDSKK